MSRVWSNFIRYEEPERRQGNPPIPVVRRVSSQPAQVATKPSLRRPRPTTPVCVECGNKPALPDRSFCALCVNELGLPYLGLNEELVAATNARSE